MESDYRLAAKAAVRHRTVVGRALGLLLSGLLAACGGSPTGNHGTSNPGAAVAETAQKLPIIVNLAVGEGSRANGDSLDNGMAAVTARVMERLKAAMPAEDLAAVRTFGSLPAMALPADGALIARLLAMPEVASIELDQELQPLDGTAGELTFE